MKYMLALVFMVLVAGVIVYALTSSGRVLAPRPAVASFAECIAAGYPVMESYPRQCRTPDGRTYAEELPMSATYEHATADDITIELPFPGAVVGKTFSAVGQARGRWYFEAVFPVEVVAPNGTVLARAQAQAQGDWMTESFVPFRADLAVPQDFIGPALLILKRDNPSALPENDASMTIPITVEY